MKRSGLSMAAMVATVVMVLTVSTYAITARTVNPVVGLSFQGTTAVCHAKCFAGSDNDNIQATLGSGLFRRTLLTLLIASENAPASTVNLIMLLSSSAVFPVPSASESSVWRSPSEVRYFLRGSGCCRPSLEQP